MGRDGLKNERFDRELGDMFQAVSHLAILIVVTQSQGAQIRTLTPNFEISDMTVNTDKKASAPASVPRGQGKTANKKTMYFYQDDHFITELSDEGIRHIVQLDDIPVAQLEDEKKVHIFQKDYANTVLAMRGHAIAYTPYGYHKAGDSAALIAYNGQRLNPLIEAYALGNGNRIYRPALFSFTSPDPFSPFLEGGLNTYAYCQCDPINKIDASGNAPQFRNWIKGFFGRKREKAPANDPLLLSSPGKVEQRAPSLQQRPLPESPSGALLAAQKSPIKPAHQGYRSREDAIQARNLEKQLKKENKKLAYADLRLSNAVSNSKRQVKLGNGLTRYEAERLSQLYTARAAQNQKVLLLDKELQSLRKGNDS